MVKLGLGKRNVTKDIAPKKKTAKSLKISDPEFISRVEKKAYELFVQRGYQHGNDLQDWIKAEELVRQEISN